VGYSQDEAGALAAKLEKLSSYLRQQREQHSRERVLAENQKTLLHEEIESLKTRESELKDKRGTLEDESEALEASLRELGAAVEKLRQRHVEVEKLAGERAAWLTNCVNSSLPVGLHERSETVAELLAGSETPLETLKLLWQLYVQEYRRGGEIEMTSPVTSGKAEAERAKAPRQAGTIEYTIMVEGGAKLQGLILRIGTVGAIFLSDDGKTAAILARGAKGYAWREVHDGGRLSQIRRAFEISAGRRAPEVVRVPLQAGAGEGGK
jgi:predicted RNase H-like nuclease (RuvC/YqgF family)